MIGDYDFPKSDFTKAMLTGLFIGFFATVVCLAYNVFYRESTGFSPADFINVSSLIFAVNLLFWVLGIIYYLFFKYFRKGDTIFFIVFVLLVAYCIWKSAEANRSDIHEINVQFRGLLLGIVIILGIGTLLIPVAFHNKRFEREVL
jgi:hypothetical protein